MSHPTAMQQAVNNFHREGFAVIPVVPDSKRAAIEWMDYQERRPTIEELIAWFRTGNKNVAIICGSVSGGLAVLDIDDPDLAMRIADDPPLQAETTIVRTPRGGLHVWVIETDGVTRSGPLVPGVADLKAEGGYVLAPPSSIDGRPYTVLTNTTIKCVPDAREWAVGLLRAYEVTLPQSRRKPLSVAETIEEMEPGNRNDSLFRMICKLQRHGLATDDIAAFARQTGRDQGLPDREIGQILRSASNYPSEYSETEDRTQTGPVLVKLAEVERENISWLWESYIPRRRLCLLDGDPGVGKSWLSLAIAAAVTRGTLPPDQASANEPANVLLLTAEDGLGDTIRPRLEDMDADLSRVKVLTAIRDGKGGERHPSLVVDLPALEQALAEGGYALVIIDPINAYLGTALDTHRDASLRAVLTPLASLADRWNVAIMCIRHLTKGGRDKAIYRGQGSIAYTAAARVVHLVGVNPDDPQERVMACIKNNLSPQPPAIAFEVTEGRFLWRGETSVTAAALLAPDGDEGERSAMEDSMGLLRESLSGGPVDQVQMQREARRAGITERTLRRAKIALGVKSERQGGLGGDGRWVWSLP